MAILEDGRVAEVQIERRGKGSVVGHIWKGRVESVLAGMEASFIEVGIGKNGFLHVDDVVAVGVPKKKRLIADMLKKGDEVIVQAVKDPMGTKGARLTMQLSLAGRFLVYVPFGDGIGISKRLDDDERHRLRDICKRLPKDGGGIIVRTAAAGASATELARDLASLNLLWKAIRERADKVDVPSLLYSEADSSLKVIRDILNDTVDEVLVDDPKQHERIVGFLRRTSPELADRVKVWEGTGELLKEFGVEDAIRSTLSRRVPLASGGSLVIDDTEAMTVVDVNSGKNVGRGNTNLEDTITRTNLEAAEEVVRQLRLRDIGGIIVIDFIDMDDAKNRRAVTRALNDALAKDRSRTFVVEISPLGLVQMTRQNISDGVREIMTQACPTCGGQGFVVSPETHAIDAERQIRLALAGTTESPVAVAVHPEVKSFLTADDNAALSDIEESLGLQITLEADPSLAPGSARIGGGSAGGGAARSRSRGGRSRAKSTPSTGFAATPPTPCAVTWVDTGVATGTTRPSATARLSTSAQRLSRDAPSVVPLACCARLRSVASPLMGGNGGLVGVPGAVVPSSWAYASDPSGVVCCQSAVAMAACGAERPSPELRGSARTVGDRPAARRPSRTAGAMARSAAVDPV